MIGLYIHVPFCSKICDYCDFNTIMAPVRLHEEYLTLLEKEISTWHRAHPGVLSSVETLYLGGGTPSILSPECLDRLFGVLDREGVRLTSLRESTMEFNPESCDAERLEVARKWGVNRVSLGLQTLSDELLATVGRSHTVREGLEALELLLSDGRFRVSADLMFDLPGQSLESFLRDLSRISDYPLGHISFYGLKVDERTRLGQRLRRGELVLDEDLYAPMYLQGVDLLRKKGFERYETSNFARPGERSLHNLNYWHCGEYVAFGPGAHGYFKGVRYCHAGRYPAWRRWIRGGCLAPSEMWDVLDETARAEELVMLSLRTNEGLSLRRLQSLGYALPPQAIAPWLSKNYLVQECDQIRLEGEGWLFMDSVLVDLLSKLVIV